MESNRNPIGTDLMDAGETRGLPDRVLSVRVPKGEEQDRLKVMAEYDRMPDGFMILGKKGGRLTLLAINGVQVHGRRGWTEDGAEP